MSDNLSKKPNELEKTTDSIFEFPFYNRKGKLHRQKITQIAFLVYIATVFALYNIGSYIYHTTTNGINIFEYYSSFIEQTALYISERFTDIQTYDISSISMNEILIISALLSVPIIPVILFSKWVFKKARIQANLATVGLGHYYLKSKAKKQKVYMLDI